MVADSGWCAQRGSVDAGTCTCGQYPLNAGNRRACAWV